MEAEEIYQIHEEVLHESMLQIGGNHVLKEAFCLLQSPEVLQDASGVEPSPELEEGLAELFMETLQGVESYQRLLGRTDPDEAIDLDRLREP